MANFMSRNRRSSDFGVDLNHLKIALDHIQSQVAVPFVERRKKASKLEQRDAAAELEDVIEELNERESELNAAVGIAKMLMNKMTLAQESVKYIDEELELTESKCRILENDLDSLRQTHEMTEKENSANSKALEAMELHAAELTQENAKLQKKALALKTKTKTRTEAQREQLAQELEAIVAEKEAVEADLESKAYTERLNAAEKQVEDAEAIHSKLEERLQKSEDQHEIYRAEIEKLQGKIRTTEEEVAMKQDQVNTHLGKIKILETKLTSVNKEKSRLMT